MSLLKESELIEQGWVPRRGQVFVKRHSVENTSKGGIVIPQAEVTANTGTILAVGKPARAKNGVEVESGIAVGDVVAFRPFKATVDREIAVDVLALNVGDVEAVYE